MTIFLIKSAILLAIAFIIGCIFGCLFRRWFTNEEKVAPAIATAAAASTATIVGIDKQSEQLTQSLSASTDAIPEIVSPPASLVSIAPAAVEESVGSSSVKSARPKSAKLASKSASKSAAKVQSTKVETVIPPAAKPQAVKLKESKPKESKPKSTPKVDVVKSSNPDDLKLIVGIGPVNERKLHAAGIFHFAQIAAWTPKDEESYGQKLEFPGRIEREQWVRQAKSLAAGGVSEDAAELARSKPVPKKKTTKKV